MATILDLLEDGATHPAEVIFLPNRAASTTFEELWRLTEATAAFWSEWPIGTSVAGVLTSSPHMIAALVGAWRAGLRFVSMPLPGRNQDADAYRRQIEDIVRMADVVAIVLDDVYAETLPSPGVPLVPASRCQRRGGKARLHETGEFVQFSSGTTGAPKGACLSLSAITAAVRAQLDALQIRPGDVSCFWVPLSHDFGLIGGLLSSWAAATSDRLGPHHGRFVCVDPAHFIMQPGTWMQACAEFGATITGGPAFAYGMAARHLQRRGVSGSLAPLRACVVGAELISVEVLRAFSRAAEPHGFDPAAMCPAYGLAEATLAVTMKPVTEGWKTVRLADDRMLDAAGARPETEVVVCGTPVRDMEARIEGDSGFGEIQVRGPSLMTGYLKRDARFTTDGWLRTGDLGFLSDEQLCVVGREDGVLRIGGRNVSAYDLEQQAERHPAVRRGNCVACSDGAGRYVVTVEHRPDADPSTLSEVPQALRIDLARTFGTGPSEVIVVPPGTIPKTPSGKLQRSLVMRSWDDFAKVAVSRL